MKYLVLLIFLLSPVLMQDDRTPEEDAREVILLYKLALQKAKKERVAAKERLDAVLLEKQNLSITLQTHRQNIEDLKRNISLFQTDIQTCENEIEQYANEIKGKNATNYQQEIDTVQNRIQEVLREKNDKMPLTQKQNEEKNPQSSTLSAPTCFLNNLIDFKSSLFNNLLSGLLG